MKLTNNNAIFCVLIIDDVKINISFLNEIYNFLEKNSLEESISYYLKPKKEYIFKKYIFYIINNKILIAFINQDNLNFEKIIKIVSYLQYIIIKNGYVAKGKLSFEEIIFQEKMITGEYINYLEEETKKMIVHRIEIEKKLTNHIQKLCELNKHGKLSWNLKNPQTPINYSCPKKHRLILRDIDKKYFINYLEISADGDKYCSNNLETLKVHYKKIISGLKKGHNDTQVFQSYVWLAQYHNFFIEEHADLFYDITAQELKKLYIKKIEKRNFQYEKIFNKNFEKTHLLEYSDDVQYF